MEIEIKGQKLVLRYTMRMFYLFEKTQKKSYEGGYFDNSCLFLCCILVNNPDYHTTFDEFVDALDEDSSLLTQFIKFLEDEYTSRQGEKKTMAKS